MSNTAVKDFESNDRYWLVARIHPDKDDPKNDFFLLRFEPKAHASNVSIELTFVPQRRADPELVVTPPVETYEPNGYMITHEFGIQYERVIFEITYSLPGESEPVVIERFASHTQGGAVYRPARVVVKSKEAPRLSVALNACPVPDPKTRRDWKASFNEDRPEAPEILYLLQRIWEQLNGGLMAPWRHACAVAGQPVKDLHECELNEQWARLYTEQFLGCRYSSPGNSRKSNQWDGVFFRPMQDRPDPPLPLMVACQQASTAAMVLYGFRPLDDTSSQHPDPVFRGKPHFDDGARTLGDNDTYHQNRRIVHYLGGIWIDKHLRLRKDPPPTDPEESKTKANPLIDGSEVMLPASKIAKAIQEFELGPCSNVTFSEGRHIAHVLRIRRLETDSRLQFFDVRGMQTRPNSQKVEQEVRVLGLAERYDVGYATGISTAFDDPFSGPGGAPGPRPDGKAVTIGFGILPHSEESAKKIEALKAQYPGSGSNNPAKWPLREAVITRMKNAWPLGFVRLVLLDRWRSTPEAPQVLYATPLLRMHTKSQSFFLSRLMWSLRNLPFAERIQAVWQVDITMLESTQALLDSKRGDKRLDVLEKCLKLRYPTGTIPDDVRYTAGKPGLMPYVDIQSRTDGWVESLPKTEDLLHASSPRVHRKKMRPEALKAQLSWREARGLHRDLSTHSDLPDYLAGKDV